jgi:predicted lipid-binding transport protein (Tim44 family)
MAMGSADALAKRIGGGGSLGKQSGNVTQRSSLPPTLATTQPAATAGSAARPATPAAAAPSRPWGAMLGGMAAGLGLAWLASSLGLGEGFAQFLLVALLAVAAVAVIGLVMRRRNPAASPGGLAYQSASPAGKDSPEPRTPRSYSPKNVGNDASARPWESSATSFDASASGDSMIGSALDGSQGWGVPAGFDTEGFLSASKANFIQLQDAWDRSDIPSLRAMMTDAMLEEIRSQLAEREKSGGVNKTEVVMLEAHLLGIEEMPDAYMASVEFSGLIREDASAGPNPFREVWNITRPKTGAAGWLVAGVQALQ